MVNNPTIKHTFPKDEHLYGEIRIEQLFKNGDKFLTHPIKVVYSIVPREKQVVRVLFSVPKRNVKLAVKRNRIKRLMREAYRLNKHILTKHFADKDYSLHIALCYITSDEPSLKTLNKKTGKLITRLIELYP